MPVIETQVMSQQQPPHALCYSATPSPATQVRAGFLHWQILQKTKTLREARHISRQSKYKGSLLYLRWRKEQLFKKLNALSDHTKHAHSTRHMPNKI